MMYKKSANHIEYEPPRGKTNNVVSEQVRHKRPVQAQKRARSLKFRIKVEEESYYPRSENKGADQLRGYREADLRLLFSPMQIVGFPMRRLIY